jgi:hypothetical protein
VTPTPRERCARHPRARGRGPRRSMDKEPV